MSEFENKPNILKFPAIDVTQPPLLARDQHKPSSFPITVSRMRYPDEYSLIDLTDMMAHDSRFDSLVPSGDEGEAIRETAELCIHMPGEDSAIKYINAGRHGYVDQYLITRTEEGNYVVLDHTSKKRKRLKSATIQLGSSQEIITILKMMRHQESDEDIVGVQDSVSRYDTSSHTIAPVINACRGAVEDYQAQKKQKRNKGIFKSARHLF